MYEVWQADKRKYINLQIYIDTFTNWFLNIRAKFDKIISISSENIISLLKSYKLNLTKTKQIARQNMCR